MEENDRPFVPGNRMRIIWPILAIGAALVIIGPGVQKLVDGAPVEEWIESVVLGLLFVLLYFGTKTAGWIENDQSSSGQFGLSGWAVLVISTLWVVVGLAFFFTGFRTAPIAAYIFFGVIGVVGMVHKLRKSRSSKIADGM